MRGKVSNSRQKDFTMQVIHGTFTIAVLPICSLIRFSGDSSFVCSKVTATIAQAMIGTGALDFDLVEVMEGTTECIDVLYNRQAPVRSWIFSELLKR
jgi:hypothetical protein